MERRPAVGSKCGVGILHVCQVKDHHQERSDNNIDCSPSHLDHYIKKTFTVRFILDHPVYIFYFALLYIDYIHKDNMLWKQISTGWSKINRTVTVFLI